jgi:hypothetical protein
MDDFGMTVVTYAGGLIALAIVVRYGPEVSGIIQTISKSGSMFAGVLLGQSGG